MNETTKGGIVSQTGLRCVVLGGDSWGGLSDGFLSWGSDNDVGYTGVGCGGLACETC